MPWHKVAKKDVVNCEKSRRAVSKLRPVNIRMGQPVIGKAITSLRGGIRGELKHLSNRRKRK